MQSGIDINNRNTRDNNTSIVEYQSRMNHFLIWNNLINEISKLFTKYENLYFDFNKNNNNENDNDKEKNNNENNNNNNNTFLNMFYESDCCDLRLFREQMVFKSMLKTMRRLCLLFGIIIVIFIPLFTNVNKMNKIDSRLIVLVIALILVLFALFTTEFCCVLFNVCCNRCNCCVKCFSCCACCFLVSNNNNNNNNNNNSNNSNNNNSSNSQKGKKRDAIMLEAGMIEDDNGNDDDIQFGKQQHKHKKEKINLLGFGDQHVWNNQILLDVERLCVRLTRDNPYWIFTNERNGDWTTLDKQIFSHRIHIKPK